MFFNGGRPPSWIVWRVLGPPTMLVVSIVVQNLIEIDTVVSIMWNFQYFARFCLKTPIHAPEIGVLGDFTPEMGSNINETLKKHILALVYVVWAIKRENPSTGLTSVTCRWVPEKGCEYINLFPYISSICKEASHGRICTKFVTAVGAADIITCTKFFGDRSRGVDSVGGRKLPSPIDKAILR